MRFRPAARSLRFAAACLLPAAMALAAAKKHPESPWKIAEAARSQLASIPPSERTSADYSTVMDAYRIIYHTDPADLHAPEAIFAVGDLLAEEGLVLHDGHAFQSAIGQYEFLRKNYPTSSLRIAALLGEAHVAAAGMHDRKLAREKYAAFVDQYPHSSHVDEARSALAALRGGTLPAVTSGPLAAPQTPARSSSAYAPSPQGVDADGAVVGDDAGSVATVVGTSPSGVPVEDVDRKERKEASHIASHRSAAPSQTATQAPLPEAASSQAAPSQTSPSQTSPSQTAPSQASGANSAGSPGHTRTGKALVSGIRFWSTPTYTRVAIDLGDEVEYQAARVPNPDRIYFDLHGTRLAADLVGKSFEIVDNGFLRRIRAAQYTADKTRIVLDVNDVTEYSAFLLPNPYRLIIDIHGGGKPAADGSPRTSTPAAPPPPPDPMRPLTGADLMNVPSRMAAAVENSRRSPVVSSTGPESRLPATATTSRADTAPGSSANRTATSREVASLSQQPDKVEATSRPTSQPIAVVAAAKSPAAGTVAAASPATDAESSPKTRRSRESAADISSRRTAAPTAEGQRSLMRALGLKIGRIVIDPGHGGHDSGTLGPGGIMEKDVVLDVSLRLGKLLHDHLGAEIIYTRSDDTFIPLETRTAIANKAEADLFLSIHANSSRDETARGVETYYLNFTSQPDALDVAARENAVSDQSVHELSDMVKKITLKDKLDESREFAQDVEESLYEGLQRGNAGLKNRGVKKAPFVVLIGANMPSVLTEISFVTNPRDASQLRTGAYRQRVAESIYHGVARYTQGLGGVRVANARNVPAGGGAN